MKIKAIKLLSLPLSICIIFTAFASCGKNEEKPPANDVKAPVSETEQPSDSQPQGKYHDARVYENQNGNPAAKTEDGTEVELTGENMQNLFAQYEKVKGSGSAEERELLDKLQLILEAPRG